MRPTLVIAARTTRDIDVELRKLAIRLRKAFDNGDYAVAAQLQLRIDDRLDARNAQQAKESEPQR